MWINETAERIFYVGLLVTIFVITVVIPVWTEIDYENWRNRRDGIE